MFFKSRVKVILFLTIILSLYSMVIYFSNGFSKYIKSTVEADVKIDHADFIKLYYSKDNNFTEEKSLSLPVEYEKKEMLHNISIQSVSEKNPSSKGTEIWIFSIKIDDKEVPLSQLQLKGQWELRNLGNNRQALISYAQTELSTASIDLFYKNKLNITFLKHDYSGFVNIDMDGQDEKFDLYNPTSVQFNQEFKPKIAINHPYYFYLPEEKINYIKIVPNIEISNLGLSTNKNMYRVEANNDYYKIMDEEFNYRQISNILVNMVIRIIISALICFFIFQIITKTKQVKMSDYGFLFYLLVFLGIGVRFVFHLDFPFAFFFNDSGGYLHTAMALTKDALFTTNLERTPGYALFIYLINIYFPYKSIYLVIIQNLIGIYISILVYNLIRRFVNKFFAYLGMTLLLFSPHLLIYEHTVLTEILFTFVLMLYVKDLITSVGNDKIEIKDVFRWGIFVALLVMIRPAGYYLIPISLIIIWIISKLNKNSFKMILKKAFIYISPIILIITLWNSWNWYKFDYFGTTAINGLGLALTAGNLVDFTSPNYQEYKDLIKEPVQHVNTEYNGELISLAKFMGYSPDGILMRIVKHTPNLNVGERDKLAYDIFKEGVFSHPLTYGYHFFHEFKKIYLHDMSNNYYTDLRGSYVNYNPENNNIFLIDKKTIVENSSIRAEHNYFGYQSLDEKIRFNNILPYLPSTIKFYFFTLIAIFWGDIYPLSKHFS
ncbi:glycosyltransferase family 39 protein [Paenibacillus sp. V4I5]|uniref:glycosyltransferase family 39 protein n=1 Tax=Paenibacillus sp. V4I5 TaxID=3042306 RepID=UPI002793D2C3|nr:glycosyltransferase family 39 protein [Paenibacillus sp. V4I5]MDQ0917611.1 hypothetical protein [Paenibacillus sp. V4I5]